jgi:hypothetical protein
MTASFLTSLFPVIKKHTLQHALHFLPVQDIKAYVCVVRWQSTVNINAIYQTLTETTVNINAIYQPLTETTSSVSADVHQNNFSWVNDTSGSLDVLIKIW